MKRYLFVAFVAVCVVIGYVRNEWRLWRRGSV